MRPVLIGLLALAMGVGLFVGAPQVAPILDARWQTATTAHETSLTDRSTPSSVANTPGPATIVVVLPGLGGIGRDLAEQLVPAAEAQRWPLLAPSPDYDPRDANESLQAADLRIDNELVSLIDRALARAELHAVPKIELIGFSRGAQSAHRFALRHPDRVSALASFSAGTYTMPTSLLPYPVGIGGFDQWNHLHAFDAVALRQVRVLVGVGTADANPADVARAWDGVGGTTRLERGTRFAQALQGLSVPTVFDTYAGVGHAFVPAMRDDAIAFLTAK